MYSVQMASTPLLSKGFTLERAPNEGMVGRTTFQGQGRDEAPPIAQPSSGSISNHMLFMTLSIL